MASAWIEHVKKVAKQKGIKYNEALKVAGASYKKADKSKPAKKSADKKGKKDKKAMMEEEKSKKKK